MSEVPTFQPTIKTQLPDYVRAGEELLWRARPTLALLLSRGVGLLGSFLFLTVFLFGIPRDRGALWVSLFPAFVVGLFVLILVLQAVRLRRTEYIVTRQGVYTRTGIIGQTVIQTTFDKITDISLKQDVLGRVFGFAALNVNTAGAGTPPVRMDGLRDALQVKSLVEEAREAYLRRSEGRGQPPSRSGSGTVQRFILDKDLLAVRCTATGKSFKRPKSDAGRRVPCPHCPRTHLATEARHGARSA